MTKTTLLELPARVDWDARNLPYMMLPVSYADGPEVLALAEAHPLAVVAHFRLMAKSFHQMPAGSLPCDQAILRRWAGIDRSDWDSVWGALAIVWQPGSAGLLYCKTMDSISEDAIRRQVTQRARTAAATEARKARPNGRRDDQRDDRRDDRRDDAVTDAAAVRDDHQMKLIEKKRKEGEVKQGRDLQPLPAAGESAPAASDPPPPAEPTKGASNRGKRLSADWVLPKAWGDWALEQRPQWDAEHVREVAMRFRNHWVAKSGKDATKLDWLATWQNWVLKEPHHMPGRPTASAAPAPGMEHLGPAGRATAEAAARHLARVMAEEQAQVKPQTTEASHAGA